MDDFEARLARWEQEWVDGPQDRRTRRKHDPEWDEIESEEEDKDGNDE